MAPQQTEHQLVVRCPDWNFEAESEAGWGQWMETPQLKEIQGGPASRIPLAHCVSSAGLDLGQKHDNSNFKNVCCTST